MTPALPRISPLMLRWFTWYCRGYVRRHFHALRISIDGPPPEAAGLPLVVYANHASWWDPLVGLLVKDECFRSRQLYAPMDATMLARYRLFAKLGFFGVEPGTRRGAVQFLRTSEAILRHANSVLAITPQSRFADVRERPLRFQSGLARLATRTHRALFVPMAIELVFWNERLPEILVRFGEPLVVKESTQSATSMKEMSLQLEHRLERTMDALSIEAQQRDATRFRTMLSGGAGQGGVYDWWRRAQAKWRGETFQKEHKHR